MQYITESKVYYFTWISATGFSVTPKLNNRRLISDRSTCFNPFSVLYSALVLTDISYCPLRYNGLSKNVY